MPAFTARTVAGTIDSAGEVTPTTLDLVAGQLLYVHGTTQCGPQVAYRLLTPSGTQYGGSPYACQDLGRVEVDQSGPRSLVVESYAGGTGPYALELAPIRPDTIGALEAGRPATARSSIRGEIHRYRFDGTAGEPVYVVSSRCPWPVHGGRPPGSSPPPAPQWVASRTPAVTSRARCFPLRATYGSSSCPAGRAASGPSPDTLVRIPPDVTEPIELDSTVTGEITFPGQALRYELSAAAGDALLFDGTGPPTTGVAYTLEGPDGRQVGPNPYADGELSAVAPATGTYTLVVASWQGGLGAYTIDVSRP